MLDTLANGKRVAVSRGELVAIGGDFRVPSILAKSGATLHEVGTTNKTTLGDYEEALAWWAGEGATTIGAERRGGNLHVWASRAGATIDAGGAEELFLPRKPGAGGGSKIGLYVARAVAETQGGRAWADVAGDTLSFHVELPLPS